MKWSELLESIYIEWQVKHLGNTLVEAVVVASSGFVLKTSPGGKGAGLLVVSDGE